MPEDINIISLTIKETMQKRMVTSTIFRMKSVLTDIHLQKNSMEASLIDGNR